MNPRAAPATLGSSVARLPSAQDAGDPGPKEKRGGPAPLPAWGGSPCKQIMKQQLGKTGGHRATLDRVLPVTWEGGGEMEWLVFGKRAFRTFWFLKFIYT